MIRLITIVIISITPCFASATDQDIPLGRLFNSPERRDTLDRQRVLNKPDPTYDNGNYEIRINGLIHRSTGRRTVWINDEVLDNSQIHDGINVHSAGQDAVVVNAVDAPQIRLKVGDTYQQGTKTTESPLGDGRIIVHRARP